jgi:RNA polymerase sigma factor (sigma-70 family)
MSDTVRAIRAKYPDVYKDLSDEELTLGIGEKYPVYLGQDAEFKDDFESYSADRNSDDTTWGMIRNAWLRGLNQATTADVLVGETGGGRWSEEDRIEEMALANRRSQMLRGSQAYQEFAEAPEEDKIGRFFQDPFEITSQVIIESLAAQFSYGRVRIPAAAAAGAAIGAISPDPFTTLFGAGAGFVSGNVVTTLGLSYGSKFSEMLQGEGVDITNPEAIKAAMSDPEFVSRARSKSLKYGIPIAVIDAITMKLGGMIAGPGRKLLTESVGGATGEAAGQLVSEGEITSPSEVLIEGLAELGPGAVQQIGVTLLQDKNVQKDLKEAQTASDDVKNEREKTVLSAFLDDIKKRQEEVTTQPTADESRLVDLEKKVKVTNAGANAGEILQDGSVPNKVVTELDDAKFSDFREVVFVDTDDPHIAHVTGIGRLTVNVRALKAHLKETGIDADEYIKRLIQEESIHDAHLKSMVGEWESSGGDLSFDEFAAQRFERIASEMTDAQKDYVRGVYGKSSDAAMGAEFVRMLVQERRHGDITESVLWNELGMKPAPATRSYFRRAMDFMRRTWIRPDLDPETIRADVENLSGILSDIEARSNDMSDVELRQAEQAEESAPLPENYQKKIPQQEAIEMQRAEDAPTSAGMEQQAAVEERRAVAQKPEPQTLEEVLNEPLEQTASEAVIPTSEVIADRKAEVVAEPTAEPTAEPELTAEENKFIEDVARKQANFQFNNAEEIEAAAVSATTDTKLAMLKKLGDGTLDRNQFKGMATRISANKILSAGRKAGVLARHETTVAPDETGQTVIDREATTELNPEEATRRKEQLQSVADAVTDLSDRQKEVVDALFYEGLSVAETAERLGITPNTVYKAKSDAINALRKKTDLKIGASTQSRRSLEKTTATIEDAIGSSVNARQKLNRWSDLLRKADEDRAEGRGNESLEAVWREMNKIGRAHV